MITAGWILSSKRKEKNISLGKISKDLLIKKEQLEAIENSDWLNLPESTFTRGFIQSYAEYLNLDPEYILALFRREYDEAKYPQKAPPTIKKRGFAITPNKIAAFALFVAVVAFIIYVLVQYLSILSAPKLEIYTPLDDLTTTIPYVDITGKTEPDTTLVIDGEFVAKDSEGNFSYQIKLEEGRNEVEIIASKKLSPKSKVIKVIRLTH